MPNPLLETDTWPYIEAMWFTRVPPETPRSVDLLVVHTAQVPEAPRSARSVAAYFQNPGLKPNGEPNKVSSHVTIDNVEIIQCVRDRHVANAAPFCNHNGIQMELSGMAEQNDAQWGDDYSVQTLRNAAYAGAQYCLKFNIPVVHLTNDELRGKKRGIIGHYQASEVFHGSDHTDPGPHFPWQSFITQVADYYNHRKDKLGIV